MKKTFYPKLAAGNIRKNSKTYIPYILTCILTAAMFYIVKSLSLNPGLGEMIGGDTISYIMELGSWIVALFAFIFLFYTNSFLVKRRKKEFGVFNILGMEKRHLAAVLGWETLYVMLLSLTGGVGLGIALDKIMFLLIGKILGAEIVLGFFIEPQTILMTVKLFAVIFVLILLNSVGQIHIANPIGLLHAGSAGEKEPKTKWLMTLAGMACVAGGYYIALTVENPLMSIFAFFIAVILVIIGTYMLFIAGSIAVLKLLKKNKKFYYKTKHFTSVSGMIYRMKQNAAGLANICILSTMVLVTVSSTCSLIIGLEDILKTRYPLELTVISHEKDEKRSEELINLARNMQKEKNMQVLKEVQYTYLSFSAFIEGDTFQAEPQAELAAVDNSYVLLFMPLSDYNATEGVHKTLREDEIMIYANRVPYDEPVLNLLGRQYRVTEQLDHFIGNGPVAAVASNALIIVLPDRECLNEIYEKQKEIYGDRCSDICLLYGFDCGSEREEQKAYYYELSREIEAQGFDGRTESREEARMSFASLYGGLFFIGLFLSILFVMATVLIIYYKQISEGYDDKERFAIMQKVGMELREVKASIRSQVLMVFFLPLAVAGIHTAASFKMLSEILAILNFVNVRLYVLCTVMAYLVFAGMYVGIYVLTARVYYRIVSR